MRNVEKVIKYMAAANKSLDVGGWNRPIRSATHVLDINDYDSRLKELSWDPERIERFTRETWTQCDICNRHRWPYTDKYFDFATCSHVLEDIRDPIWVVSELNRVAKAGYIECPSAPYELLRWPGGTVGNGHHRWFVEFNKPEQEIIFRIKSHDLIENRQYVQVTRLHVVDYSRSVDFLFWDRELQAREEIFDIREWIDQELPNAGSLISLQPISRALDKIRRLSKPRPELMQPRHGDGVKYPYL